MQPPTWDDNHNTGIPIIDWQHKTILSAIESLGFNIVSPSRIESWTLEDRAPRIRTVEQIQAIKDNFDFIYVYWTDHTRLEELFMKLYNYPELEYRLHKKQHKELFAKALKLREDIDILPIQEISTVLKELFVDHILNDDMRYVEFISNSKKKSNV